MICVSLTGPGAADCTRELGGLDFAEIRLDLVTAGEDQIRALFGSHPRLIATCRPGPRPDAERFALLLAAVEAGAAYVDLELEAEPGGRDRIAAAARRRGCQVIVSHHDHAATPGDAVLRELIERCFAAGADIAKLACAVRQPADAARLLALLGQDRPVVVIGMGSLGAVTRLAGPLLGAPFTYASLRPGRESAPGQIDHRRLARLLEELQGD